MGSSSYDYLGVSCSNIGVFTKKNIALLPSCCGHKANIIIRGQREFVAQHNSNIGTRQAQLGNISLGGFPLIELSYDYPLIRLIATITGHLGASCSNIGDYIVYG